METLLKIRRLYHKDGLSQRQIAEKLRLSRCAVKKYLNTFEYLKSLGFEGQYPCVSRFIKHYKATYSPTMKTVFIPQKFPLGESYQFDWRFEKVVLNGVETKISIAHFRLCHSRAYYVRAYLRQTLEMLIDAHNHAFDYFDGGRLGGGMIILKPLSNR